MAEAAQVDLVDGFVEQAPTSPAVSPARKEPALRPSGVSAPPFEAFPPQSASRNGVASEVFA
jgi:hypothetical protein